jgi:hypothetical protein
MADNTLDPGALCAAACHEPFEEAWKGLEAELRDSVIQVLRDAAESHRGLMAAQGLQEAPPEEWKVRAERLLEYRHVVDADVLDPLGELYESGSPTLVVTRALDAGCLTAVERCASLPASATAPWPEGALDTRPTDGFGRKVGKVFARLFSGARRAGRERPLPLRGVAARHLDRIVIPGQDRLGIATLEAWAEWSRRLEWAVARWGEAVMPALIRAERPDEEGGAEIWEIVRAAAEGLQADIAELLEEDSTPASHTEATVALNSARGALAADLAVAGSFLYRPPDARPTSQLSRLKKGSESLREWEEGIAARLELFSSLLGILSGATAVRRRTVWRFRDDCLANLSELGKVAGSLDALRAELMEPGEYGLQTRLGELDSTVASALESAARAIPDNGAVDAALAELSDSTIESLLGMIRQAPTSLEIHDVEGRPPTRGRKAERRPLPLQTLASQSFDALRIERIRSSTSGLVSSIGAVRESVASLPAVYSFARDEALRELQSEEPGAGDRADDLVGGALLRIAEALRAQSAELESGVAAAQRRLASEIADGSIALVGRAEAGRMGARLLAARSRMSGIWAWLQERWGPPTQRAIRRGTLLFARGRRAFARVLRKGSAIVGSAPPPASSTRTLQALSDTAAVFERLPLVYQRLFSLTALTDGGLLAGRAADMTEAIRRWKRWHDDDGVPVIVQGRQGSGVSSFLNVFRAEIEKDGGRVVSASIDERIGHEDALAGYLATLLDLPTAGSLRELSSSIFDADTSTLPGAVSIDNLEHLYLRVPGGTDLLERLLTLMAETEPRIFWIGAISVSAWKLVCIAEPAAVSQVDVLELEPLSPSGMREAITARHRRSGLTLRYEEPTSGMHRLRRKWRQMRHAEMIESQLEADFFERLHRTSGGYLPLALFQWLECADFTSGDGLVMRQPERLDFSVLDSLNLPQNFTLKAFVEHRSLTLEEHDEIFRLPRQESYQVIESLRNRHLLEPVVNAGEDPESRSEIEEDLRYRVRPLLTGAVISHLQARNIVH